MVISPDIILNRRQVSEYPPITAVFQQNSGVISIPRMPSPVVPQFSGTVSANVAQVFLCANGNPVENMSIDGSLNFGSKGYYPQGPQYSFMFRDANGNTLLEQLVTSPAAVVWKGNPAIVGNDPIV